MKQFVPVDVGLENFLLQPQVVVLLELVREFDVGAEGRSEGRVDGDKVVVLGDGRVPPVVELVDAGSQDALFALEIPGTSF